LVLYRLHAAIYFLFLVHYCFYTDDYCLTDQPASTTLYVHNAEKDNRGRIDYFQAVQPNKNSIDEGSVTKKRRIRLKPYYIPVSSMPRILKRDIRREYGLMMTNVMNSGDYNLVKQFYRQYFSPNLHSISKADSHDFTTPIVKISLGIDHAAFSIGHAYETIPDIAFQLQNTLIIRKQYETGSIVKLTLQVNVTPLFMKELHETIQLTDQEKDIHRNMIHYYGHGEHLETAWVEKNIDTFCMPSSSFSKTVELRDHLDHRRKLQLEPCLVCQAISEKYVQTPQSAAVPVELQIFLDDQHRAYRLESCVVPQQ